MLKSAEKNILILSTTEPLNNTELEISKQNIKEILSW